MASLKDGIVINTTSEKLWPFLTTPDLIRKWLEGIEFVSTKGNYPEVGSSFEWAYKVAGLALKGTNTVAELVPGQAIHYKVQGLLTGTQNWDISQAGGGVRVDVDNEYELGGGVLGKVAEPLVHQSNAATLKKSLANLKQQAESS